MRKIFWLCVCLPLTLGAANLLPNGDFEKDGGWKPWGWRKGVDPKAVFAYDTAVFHSGKRSLRVMDNWDFSLPYAICTVPAAPDAKGYRLTFWARAEKEQVFRAGIVFIGARKDGTKGNLLWKDIPLTAGPEWKKFTYELSAVQPLDSIQIFFGATAKENSLTGAAWIDDVELVPLDKDPTPPKEPAVVIGRPTTM